MDKEQLLAELQRILDEEAYAGTVETITVRINYLLKRIEEEAQSVN